MTMELADETDDEEQVLAMQGAVSSTSMASFALVVLVFALLVFALLVFAFLVAITLSGLGTRDEKKKNCSRGRANRGYLQVSI